MNNRKKRPGQSVAKVMLALGFFMGMLFSAKGEAVSIDFSSKPNVEAEKKAQTDIVCEVSEAPAAKGAVVFKLQWPAHEGKFVAGHIVRPADILIKTPGKYTITARVCVEQLGPECNQLALRLYDGGRENHQYSARIIPGDPGWVNVSWTVDTNNPAEGASKPWGGDKNQNLDLPVRLRGFALPFAKWKTNGGALWVDQVTATRILE